MNQLNPKEIERRLTETPAPPPPPELLESLKSDIPEPAEIWDENTQSTSGNPRRWLIAASVMVAVGGGLLGYRTFQQAELPGEALAEIDQIQPQRTPPPLPRGETEVLFEEIPSSTEVESTPQSSEQPRALPRAAEPAPAIPSGRAAVVVRDNEGNPLPGVVVELSGADDSRRLITGSAGDAQFNELDPGDWELKAELDGFSSVEYPDVEVRDADETNLEVELSVAIEEVITVTSHSPLVETRTQSAGATVRQELAKPRAKRRPSVQPPPPGPSTGGTHEPNDEPYGDVFYREYGVNPFIDTDDDTLSTFGLDVDTGSYTIARRYLGDGNLPPREAIRIEEMVNYFDYGDAPPKRGDFAVYSELAPTPFTTNNNYRVLRFGIRARVISEESRKPATLIFVVDVSGSMDSGNRLGLVKQSLRLLLDQLREDDRVGLVIYGSIGQVLLDPTSDHEAIRRAIDRLQAGGSTNAEEGLVLAYDLASRGFREEAINRIILCSDGVANVGRTGPDSILSRVRSEATRGIELTTVGFGMGNYNDVLMEQLADNGDGNYAYVDDLPEAQRIFVENLTGTLQTIAADTKVQVEFNPEVISRYRLLGYENRDLADERFRDDSVDAGEIGAGHSVTALYEVKLVDGAPRREPLATLRLRYLSKATERIVELEHEVRERDGVESWRRAPSGLKLAATVAEFGELLKGSYWAREGSLGELLSIAQELSPDFAGDRDVAELVGLIAQASRSRE